MTRGFLARAGPSSQVVPARPHTLERGTATAHDLGLSARVLLAPIRPSESGFSRASRRFSAEALEPRTLLAFGAIGPEFRVNTTTLNNQLLPAVAADAHGNFVIAWESVEQNGIGLNIYAQRYDATGAARGGEFRVNTNTFRAVNFLPFPSVAMDADGDFVVAWHGYGQDGSGNGVYARRYDAVGAARGGEFRVNTTTHGYEEAPRVAMDADGEFVVVWQSWESLDPLSTSWGVYAQRYDATGVAQGGEFRVNTTTVNDNFQPVPSVAMDADGDFVVAWAVYGNDSSRSAIYAQLYSAGGASHGGEFRVNTTMLSSQDTASVAMDADGDFVVAWKSFDHDGFRYGLYAQLYDAAGTARGGEFRVNRNAAPSVAMDAAGDFVVAWEGYLDGSGEGIYAERYNAAGAAQGDEFRVNTTTASKQPFPSVAMAANGDFVVAWASFFQDGSDFDSEIYAQRYAANEAPTTLGIPALSVAQDDADALVDLFAAFDDSTDPDPLLTYSLTGNTNPSLFSSTTISVTPAAGTLTLDYAPGQSGQATLTVRATDSGGLFTDASFLVTVLPTTHSVLRRSIFYNNSALDGNRAAADAGDDDAIATDKNALLAGQDRLPGFDNVTSYNKGINGVMIDVSNLPVIDALMDVNDFEFSPAGHDPVSINVRQGAGEGGSDRVTLTWRDYNPLDASPLPQAVANGWLTVTVKANYHTGLSRPDVFSFGNLIGETGDAPTPTKVSAADLASVKRVRNAATGVESRQDVNRDGKVNALDLGVIKRNLNRSLPQTPASVALAPSPPAPPAVPPALFSDSASGPTRRPANDLLA